MWYITTELIKQCLFTCLINHIYGITSGLKLESEHTSSNYKPLGTLRAKMKEIDQCVLF